jgi:hypothetical protein
MILRERMHAVGSILIIVLCLPAAMIYDFIQRVVVRKSRRAVPAPASADAKRVQDKTAPGLSLARWRK